MRARVNGADVELRAHPLARLLDVLREELGLTGTKEGCGEGECGACTVLVDGQPVCACLVPVAQVEGAEVLTVEGLGEDHPLMKAFAEFGGAQCGICTPGMVMAALTLQAGPSLQDVRLALAGNLCRCTGYEAIYRAIFEWLGQGQGQGEGNGRGRGEGGEQVRMEIPVIRLDGDA